MIQLYCPACENVVWLERATEDAASCPDCQQPIITPGCRKARPVNETRVFASPGRITRVPWTAPVSTREDAPETANQEKCVEQDFSLPCPEPAARFVPLPYRAEGGVNLVRLPLFLAGVALIAVILGALASALGQVCYLILIYPLALGFVLAVLAAYLGQLCQVRAPLVAGLAGMVGGLMVVLSMHVFDCQRLRDAPAGLFDYLDAMARNGLTITGGDSGGFNLGYVGTYLYWAIEGLIVAAIAAFGAANGARAPFCSGCRRWKEERFLGTLADGGAEQQKQLHRGDLGTMVCWRPTPASGELVLTASVCPRCAKEGPIDLRIERNPRGRREPASRNLPIHLTYPGEALPVLEHLFQGRTAVLSSPVET
jgi:hypothetical protein